MSSHRRSPSIPIVRLSQPLPPLPLNDVPPLIAYRDDPFPPAEDSPIEASEQLQPPVYEPMYDYLRSHQRPAVIHPPEYCPPQSISDTPRLEPYRDEPFIVTIDETEDLLPPPSYEDSETEVQNQATMQNLMRVTTLDLDYKPIEETCKFLLAMLVIALTVGAVGTAFKWGR
jgi:hypothetical protein